MQPDFVVHKISINRDGSALFLSGSDGLCIMHLYGRSSSKDNTIMCRYVKKLVICNQIEMVMFSIYTY